MGNSVEKEIKRTVKKVRTETSRATKDLSDPFDLASKGVRAVKESFGGNGGGDEATLFSGDFGQGSSIADTSIQEALKLARGRRKATTGRQSTKRTGPTGLSGTFTGNAPLLTGVG